MRYNALASSKRTCIQRPSKHKCKSTNPETKHTNAVYHEVHGHNMGGILFCVKPVSTSAKPACINITRNPVIRVHIILIPILLCPSAAPIVCTAVLSLLTLELSAATDVSFAFATLSRIFTAIVSISLSVPVFAPVGSCAMTGAKVKRLKIIVRHAKTTLMFLHFVV